MKNKLIVMSLSIILLTGLSTSSFFLSDYLTKRIIKNKHNTAQLSFAIEQENIVALRFAWEKTLKHSEQWLKLAKALAKTQGDAAYQLAVHYKNKPKQAIFWFKSAIRLNSQNASIALSQLYFHQGDLAEASKVLAALPTDIVEALHMKSLVLKVRIATAQGNVADVEKIVNKYAQQFQKTEEGRLLLEDIQKYQVQLSDNQNTKPNKLILNCDNSIQLFATNLNHLKRLESVISDFTEQALNNYVCFSPVRYMPINSLDCSYEQEQAIRCDELSWQSWASSINTRYVGIMLPKGGANVHLGVLYFDAQDNVNVVAHEISHLLGFIDEYPLVADHVTCRDSQQKPFSQNISVLKKYYQGEQKNIRTQVLKQIAWAKHIKINTPILQPVTRLGGEKNWQLGTPEKYKDEIGLFHAQTCDNSLAQLNGDFSAFKPVSQRTKLQYFALDFPELYLKMLQENSRQYSMPSFHYNIALSYFQQRNIEQANYWLKQAENWESDIIRRQKARLGSF